MTPGSAGPSTPRKHVVWHSVHAKGQDQSAELITDENGDFVTNNDFKPNALTIPLYTPSSSNDAAGNEGNITRDDNYMYVKTSTGWKRTNLESF